MLRPVRFVQADEDTFRANAAKFTDKTGVPVKVDFVGWEDINQQIAVTSNSGAGPDIIIGFGDAPHIYVDKVVELTDVADYIGKRYGAAGRDFLFVVRGLLRLVIDRRGEGIACCSRSPLPLWGRARERGGPQALCLSRTAA
jgi:hypothetical protein